MTVVETAAKDGGTPVILDDALGYTDPERLKLMGAVLAVAAKELSPHSIVKRKFKQSADQTFNIFLTY